LHPPDLIAPFRGSRPDVISAEYKYATFTDRGCDAGVPRLLSRRYLQAIYVSLRKLKNQRQSVGTNLGSPRRGRKLDVIV